MEVIKLTNQTLTTEHSTISSNLPSLTLQPNGISLNPKLFSFSNFILELNRLFCTTFISNYRSILSTTFIFAAYFTILSSIFANDKASASGCFAVDGTNSNLTTCTIEDRIENNDLVKQNSHYLEYVLQLVGFIVMTTSSAHYSAHLKVFQSEHRNR